MAPSVIHDVTTALNSECHRRESLGAGRTGKRTDGTEKGRETQVTGHSRPSVSPEKTAFDLASTLLQGPTDRKARRFDSPSSGHMCLWHSGFKGRACVMSVPRGQTRGLPRAHLHLVRGGPFVTVFDGSDHAADVSASRKLGVAWIAAARRGACCLAIRRVAGLAWLPSRSRRRCRSSCGLALIGVVVMVVAGRA